MTKIIMRIQDGIMKILIDNKWYYTRVDRSLDITIHPGDGTFHVISGEGEMSAIYTAESLGMTLALLTGGCPYQFSYFFNIHLGKKGYKSPNEVLKVVNKIFQTKFYEKYSHNSNNTIGYDDLIKIIRELRARKTINISEFCTNIGVKLTSEEVYSICMLHDLIHVDPVDNSH